MGRSPRSPFVGVHPAIAFTVEKNIEILHHLPILRHLLELPQKLIQIHIHML